MTLSLRRTVDIAVHSYLSRHAPWVEAHADYAPERRAVLVTLVVGAHTQTVWVDAAHIEDCMNRVWDTIDAMPSGLDVSRGGSDG